MSGTTVRRRATLMLAAATTMLAPTAAAAQTARAGHGSPGAAYGTGIVTFPFDAELGGTMPAADTLVIRGAPSSESPVLARFVFRSSGPMGWSYAMEAADGVRSNALEYGYEVEGLPLDSVAPDGGWARVLYGVTEGADHAALRRGWVRVSDGHARVRLWADALPEHWLHFLRPAETMSFHETPGGARVAFEPARAGDGAFDYRMEPIEVEGRWMKVRVVTPNVPCSPAAGEPREATLWIEYLDAQNRPRVWYHTRGC